MGIRIFQRSANPEKGPAASAPPPAPNKPPKGAKRSSVRSRSTTRLSFGKRTGVPSHGMASYRPILTSVYRVFGLRRGTIMIAIHDLMWNCFLVFLLVLAASHTREVALMAEKDLQAEQGGQAGAPTPPCRLDHSAYSRYVEYAIETARDFINAELNHLDMVATNDSSVYHFESHDNNHSHEVGDSHREAAANHIAEGAGAAVDRGHREGHHSHHRGIVNHHSNELKLFNGHQIARIMTMFMVFGISMAGIDMIASMMLLAGAVLQVRQLMMPWLSLRLIEVMMLLGLSFTLLTWYAKGLLVSRLFVVNILVLTWLSIVVFYHWLVAFSLHEAFLRYERTSLYHRTHPTSAAAAAASSYYCQNCNGLIPTAGISSTAGRGRVLAASCDLVATVVTKRVAPEAGDAPQVQAGAEDSAKDPVLLSI